jgi:hypothetical protein
MRGVMEDVRRRSSAGRVMKLERSECAAQVERLKGLPELVGIAQTCSAELRFEYEAMLGAAYATQSLLGRAVIESLTGQNLEGERRFPSFSHGADTDGLFRRWPIHIGIILRRLAAVEHTVVAHHANAAKPRAILQ